MPDKSSEFSLACQRMGLSQRKAAEALGISLALASKMANSNPTPTSDAAKQRRIYDFVCDRLRVAPGSVLPAWSPTQNTPRSSHSAGSRRPTQ